MRAKITTEKRLGTAISGMSDNASTTSLIKEGGFLFPSCTVFATGNGQCAVPTNKKSA
jgi:hypothetical protein